MKIFLSSILLLLITLSGSSTAQASAPNPGDSCTSSGATLNLSGPEQIPGRTLLCNGTVWKTAQEWSAAGKTLLQIDDDGGSCDSSKIGRLRYDGAISWEYCSSTGWRDLLTNTFSFTGDAYCWGYNGNSRLGDGTVIQRLEPTAVSGGLKFSRISAGSAHSCGITTTGIAYCWGMNQYGRLGDGTTTQRLAPTVVSGGITWSTISAGEHSCGFNTTGAAYCWGGNGSGELGIGVSPGDRNIPTAVVGGLTFT